ncbi:farnesol dehydrogenase-like [Photinus pyralis]|uniref:farnesol dehydrogenase-like n=1 Tax=Photinus pyralis TaxID=7054 RepID=UPI001266ED6D|nr:farnesol dehydrogenase-like [Photinus pyralis]
MERWSDKVAVVTGASAGIGRGLAEHLVDCGLKVVGLARRKDKLNELADKLKGRKGTFIPVVADVTKESDVLNAFDWTTKNVGVVHILINNAGLARAKGLLDGETEAWWEIFDTNLLALCVATREAIKIMRANGVDGHIVHMNSTGGHYVPNVPNVNVYCASKFGVTALTETLRQELNAVGSKIKVTSVSPGFVEAGVLENSELSATVKEVQMCPGLKIKDVCDAVEYVLATPPHVQVHEIILRAVGQQI